MKKLMVILITGLLYMSCTDSMEVSGDADRNNTEDISVRLVITIPASTTYARTRGTFATTDHESKISEIQELHCLKQLLKNIIRERDAYPAIPHGPEPP